MSIPLSLPSEHTRVALSLPRFIVASAPVLLVADLLQPIDVLAVLKFRDGDMRHRGRRRCSMPMPQAGREPDDIAGPDFLDRPALRLCPAEPGRDDQRLAERMRVPRTARARLERDVPAGYARRIARLEQWVDAHRASEVIRRSLGGRPRAVSCDLHCSIPCLSRNIRPLRGGSSGCCQRSDPGAGENAPACDHGSAFRCTASVNLQRSLSGVIGSSRMRLPVAWKIALAMAGATPTMAISPTPFTPSGFTCGSCSSTKITSMTGGASA